MINEIREKCLKLKPVIGDKMTGALYLKYQTAKDLDAKKRWERRINLLYAAKINDEMDTETVNLPPPANDILDGEYGIGRIIYKGNPTARQFGLRENEWTRHVLVNGVFSRSLRSSSGDQCFIYAISMRACV